MASDQPRIFVVDDEDVISCALTMLLRYQGGYHVTAFNKPAEALAAAYHDPPDLLITDVVMPVLNGIELATRIQSLCPGCKVLLFSGHPSTPDMLESSQSNEYSFDLLTKPVHPGDLMARIQDLTVTKLQTSSLAPLPV